MVGMGRRTRLQYSTTRHAPERVHTFRPNPAAWQAALKLADGDASRLRVVAEDVIEVENKT